MVIKDKKNKEIDEWEGQNRDVVHNPHNTIRVNRFNIFNFVFNKEIFLFDTALVMTST